jgi:general secretion pathway protein K
MGVTSNKEGFVLIAVIWLAGLLASVGTSLAVKVRVDTLAAANVIHNSQAELFADGMARLIAFRLAGDAQLQKDGSPSTCQWNKETRVEYLVQDQAGLIDLNTNDIRLFEILFEKLGLPSNQAQSLSAALQDFRDVDDVGSDSRPEPEQYAKRMFGPKNGPFQAIEELHQLPGMTEQLYRSVLPFVTVHSAQPGLDPTTTPAALRKLFGEFSPGTFNAELKDRAAPPQRKIFGVDVRVTTDSGGRYRRRALVNLLRQPDQPLAILEWQNGFGWEDVKRPGDSATACFN